MNSFLSGFKAAAGTALRDLWSEDRGWILLTIGVGWAFSIGLRFVYPTLIPSFQAEFGIDLATGGLLLTALWAAYALGHIPGGFLGDRIGEGNVLMLSTAISAGTVLVVAGSVTVWMLFLGTIVFGLATALYGPTRFTVFTDIYPDRAGSAIGLTMAAGSAGNAVLPVVAVVVATYTSWRLGVGLFFPLFLGVFVALWLVAPRRTSDGERAVEDLSIGTIRTIAERVLGSDGLPTVVAIQITASFIIQGFASFYPTYLTITKGVSPGVAASLYGLFFATGAVVQPISGGLMDRFGLRWTLTGSLVGCVVALWLLPFVDGIIPLVAITLLFSTWNGSGVVTQTFIADALPADIQGTGLGVLKAGWMTIGATSPLVIGIMADYGYLDEGFLLLAAVGTLGVALTVLRL